MFGIGGILIGLGYVISGLVPILIALALAAMIYGGIKMIYYAGSTEKRREGMSMLIYGVIALFVMVSLWGLVAFLQGTLLDPWNTAYVFHAPLPF